MADGIVLNPGTGGATLDTDDIGGVHTQIVKVAFGPLDTRTLVSTTDPIPVDLRTNNLSGNLNVAVAAALPAGGNNIGDVDVVSLPNTVLAGGNLVQIDYDSGAGTQNMPMVGLALPASGGAVAGGTATNPMRIDPTGTTAQPVSGTVTANAGTGSFTVAQATAGNLNAEVQGDAAHDAVVSGNPVLLGAYASAGAPTDVSADGDAVRLWADRAGRLQVGDGGQTLSVDDGAGSLTVDGTVSITGTVTVDSELPAAATLADAAGNPTTPTLGAAGLLFNGTSWDRMRGDITNGLDVDVTRVQGSVTVAQATAANLNAQVVGNVAHDAADAGNPLSLGLNARTTWPTPVTDGDRVRLIGDDVGRLVTYPFAPRDRIVRNRIVLNSTTETTLIAAGGVGVFRDIMWLALTNESATEVRVDIRDAAAGTVVFSLDLFPDGGGAVIPFPVPLTQAAANNAWTAQLSAAVSSVYITAIAIEQN